MSKISLKFKEAVIKEYPLDKGIITIGRNPNNDIHIDNLAVSSFHAKITKEGGRFVIEDLGSTNGTFVNEKRIVKCALRGNETIAIGKHVLVFSSPEAENADMTMKAKKPVIDKTMVLDTKRHKELLEKASGAGTAAAGERGKNGGFTVIDGSTDKPEYELAGRLTTIGKSDTSGIKLKGLFAPKVAALVNRTKDGYFVSPPGTGKKPSLNGRPLEGRTELKDGDILEAGGVKMQFYFKE